MITRTFRYHRPSSPEHAALLLHEEGATAAILSGGTVLVPWMHRGLKRPTAVIDLTGAGLSEVTRDDGEVVLGAAVSYRTLLTSSIVADTVPLLRTLALAVTGGPQLRSQATIGGSACFANPGSDIPACLVALDASMEIVGLSGPRLISATHFFQDAFKTAVQPDELLTRIRIPVPPPGMRHAFLKLKICESSWPIVTTSTLIARDGVARVGIGGATPIPFLVKLPPDTAEQEIRRIVDSRVSANEWTDDLGGPGYRRAVAATIAIRCWQKALTA